jgi:hypothetical protein
VVVVSLHNVLSCVNFFEELRANDGRMKVKENCQRKSDTLDHDPRHEAEKVGLVKTRSHLKSFAHHFLLEFNI